MGIFQNSSENTVVFVSYGDAAILNLPPIDSNPPPSVIWQDENGRLRFDRKYAITENHQLVILSANQEDEKAYR